MNLTNNGGSLRIGQILELSGDAALSFRSDVRRALVVRVLVVEIDLSNTQLIDSVGIGALHGVYTEVIKRNPEARIVLLNPQPLVKHLLDQTTLPFIMEIRCVPQPVGEPVS